MSGPELFTNNRVFINEPIDPTSFSEADLKTITSAYRDSKGKDLQSIKNTNLMRFT